MNLPNTLSPLRLLLSATVGIALLKRQNHELDIATMTCGTGIIDEVKKTMIKLISLKFLSPYTMAQRVSAPDHKLTASFVRRAPVVASLLGPPRLSKPAVNLGPVTSTLGDLSIKSMKRSQLNGLARGLASYLVSRNNDISGYSGLGMLCALARYKQQHKFRFRIFMGCPITIFGCELTDSQAYAEKVHSKGNFDIVGTISFQHNGTYSNRHIDKYLVVVSISNSENNRIGMHSELTFCWPHDESIEKRRYFK